MASRSTVKIDHNHESIDRERLRRNTKTSRSTTTTKQARDYPLGYVEYVTEKVNEALSDPRPPLAWEQFTSRMSKLGTNE